MSPFVPQSTRRQRDPFDPSPRSFLDEVDVSLWAAEEERKKQAQPPKSIAIDPSGPGRTLADMKRDDQDEAGYQEYVRQQGREPGGANDPYQREAYAVSRMPKAPEAAPVGPTPFADGLNGSLATDEDAEAEDAFNRDYAPKADGTLSGNKRLLESIKDPAIEAAGRRILDKQLWDKNMKGLSMFGTVMPGLIGAGMTLGAGRGVGAATGELVANATGIPVNPVTALGGGDRAIARAATAKPASFLDEATAVVGAAEKTTSDVTPSVLRPEIKAQRGAVGALGGENTYDRALNKLRRGDAPFNPKAHEKLMDTLGEAGSVGENGRVELPDGTYRGNADINVGNNVAAVSYRVKDGKITAVAIDGIEELPPSGLSDTSPFTAPVAAPSEAGGPFPIEEVIAKLAADAKERKPGTKLTAGVDVGEIFDSFKVAPGLELFPMPDDVTMPANRAYSGLISRMAGAGDTAADMGRSIGMSDNPAFEKLFRDYLDYSDEASRAVVREAEGLPNLNRFVSTHTGKPMTAAELGAKADEAKDALTGVRSVPSTVTPGNTMSVPNMPGGEQFFDENMAKIEEWRRKLANRAAETGQLPYKLVEDPDIQGPFRTPDVRENYIPHILDERVQEEALPGISNRGDANKLIHDALAEGKSEVGLGQPTGLFGGGNPIKELREKHATGSTKEMLGDPLQRLSVKAGQVERRALMNEFIDRLKHLDLTEKVLGVPERGIAPTLKYDHDTMRLLDIGKRRLVLPVQVAEALSKASKTDRPMVLRRAWQEINNIAKTGLLRWNPSFQIKQVMDDLGTGYSNVAWGKKKEFLKRAEKHARILLDEFGKLKKGGFSEVIAKYRDRNLMTEVYESLIDTSGEMKRISDKTLKGHAPGFIDKQALIRETSIKAAMADIYETMGATPERAVDIANKWTGDYISKSAGGKVAADILPMTKWYATQLKRLTVGALEDPVGRGIGSAAPEWAGTVRGIKNSPYATLLPVALLAATWNMFVSDGKNSDFDGLLIPGTKQKVGIPGYGSLATFLKGLFTDSDDYSAKSVAARSAAPIQIGFEGLSGKKVAGPKVNPVRSEVNVPNATQDALLVKRGGHPAMADLAALSRKVPYLGALTRDPFQNQSYIEKLTSLPGQIRRVTDKDLSLGDRLLNLVRIISPLNITDTTYKDKSLSYKAKDQAMDAYVNASGEKAKVEARKAFMAAGGTLEELMQRARAGQRESDKLLNQTKEQRDREARFLRFKRGH